MHLINISDLKKTDILTLFNLAKSYKKDPWQPDVLKHKTIALLFSENSTRTRCSFELAAKRLGATVLNLDLNTSSTQKGESLLDTVWNLEAMLIDAFVIRSKEENIGHAIALQLKSSAKIINAGSGILSHPTQALLDAFTLNQHIQNFENLSIAIVGDIAHSRVAQSNIACLKMLGVRDIRLIAPKSLLPNNDLDCGVFTNLSEGIRNVDVIMMLRMQKERMESSDIPNLQEYCKHYQLTAEKLVLAKPQALIMHPGPINRNIEMSDEVADGPHSIILQQTQNGVFMRQAILEWLLK